MLFQKMFGAARQNHLCFSPVFRPSAFRMSPHVFGACLDSGIKTLAISDRPNINSTYNLQDKYFQKYGNVVYYNINPPVLQLKLNEKMSAVYHACEWSENYLNAIKVDSLKRFLSQYIDDVKFVFMENMNGE